MLVKDIMTSDVVTVGEDQSMLEAREILRGKNLVSLPVTDDLKRIRGIITVDDIGKASPSDSSTLSRYEANYLLGRLKVKDVMRRTVVTVDADDTIEFVAYKLYKYRVNALPVVNQENRLCGIVSRSDIFRSIVEMMGMNRNCLRITIEAPDKVGVVAEISNIMKEDGINIISLVTKQNGDGTAEITIRAALNNNGMDIIEQIREAGYVVSDVMTLDGIE
ncbi:CBS domain-containing protein [uncultured Phascolarctobacterium sp.]|jgi:acetoin utilization protein AcuB|uniref:CBS domain-containing protein n=1 Tax=uncultured Phascolarctobacterium sp. TaxID=512296 RepID=UPI0025D218E3|nr:CBS domain-containing protein [uncultured Phascolarctobacterium sp.]